jgi:hypothetical protein
VDVATPITLKGSLFDEIPIGTIDYEGPLPQIGDVIECEGKSYTITDLMDADGVVALELHDGEPLIAIVEPLAVSQRRGR